MLDLGPHGVAPYRQVLGGGNESTRPLTFSCSCTGSWRGNDMGGSLRMSVEAGLGRRLYPKISFTCGGKQAKLSLF